MRALYLSLLLALPACQIIGDPMGPSDSATDTSTSEPEQTTSTTDATVTTTAGTDTTSEGTTTEAQPTTSGTTGPSDMCEGLDQAECAVTADCREIVGTPLDFAGCNPLPAYLGCIVQTDCGLMPTTVCRPNSLEAYVLDDTCVPADLEVCDSMLPLCGESCLGLDEAACVMDPNCTAHFGAPHVEENMMVCADFANPQFLGCDKLQQPCPPAVVTVCPIGQPDVAFDVASGCTPPDFEPCMDGPAPECP